MLKRSDTDKRVVIITGHYGSGKTEFAVNYAVKMKELYQKVCIADLDIVNLYFRSTEKKDLFGSLGIRLLECTVPGNSMDLPSIPRELQGALLEKNTKTIIDAGGDSVGARVLRQYRENILEAGYDLFLVVNAHRKETQTKDGVLSYLSSIENESGLQVSGLINNTHLLKETTPEDIYLGHRLVEEISEFCGIPVAYESAIAAVAEKIPDLKNMFPLQLYMRDTWMS